MNDPTQHLKTDLAKEVWYLKNKLQILQTFMEYQQFRVGEAISKHIEENRERIKQGLPAISDMPEVWSIVQKERHTLCGNLREAVRHGLDFNIDMPNCRLLGESIEAGFDAAHCSGFVLAALAELEQLKVASEESQPKVKTRKQPEKPITIWLRANIHKYGGDRAKATRNYVEIHGGNYKKLYSDATNDLRHKPLKGPG